MSLAEAMPQHPIASSSSTPTSSGTRDPPATSTPSASTTSANTSNSTKPRDSGQGFEFTSKRKRWADLLVTELREAIVLVLSPACKVWYCGAAVEDLLGWTDEELVDGDITDLMNVDDRASFRNQFQESIHTRSSLLTYARMQCKNEFYMASDYSPRPREVLFEITGKPHYFPDSGEFRCFFADAKPYPSRNTAMVNTFLELKMENERLQQRVAHLRAQAKALNVMYPASSPTNSSNSSGAQFTQHMSQAGGDAYFTAYEETPGLSSQGQDKYNDADDDGSDPNGSRKKAKRVVNGPEQHVCQTCGRTDSPEWRKGPDGPKTLCNACGLRWAKKLRTDKSGETTSDGGNMIF